MAQKTMWITGGSTGIGAEVAQQLAREGHTVAISARSADKLAVLAQQNYGAGKILAYPLDVTDQNAVQQTVEKIIKDCGAIDLAMLCAGTYTPDDTEYLNVAAIESQFRLNVMGTVYAISALLPVMKHKPEAQIAVVASVAGYRGLPRAIGYGGTKAALINMVEAMKLDCDVLGIKLQLICPGFVKTPLTDKNTFPMPFLISVEEAGQTIVRGLKSNRFEIVFPTPMVIFMKILRWLPYRLFFPLVRKVTGVGLK